MAQNKQGRALTDSEQAQVLAGSQLAELTRSEGWEKVLKPWLESKLRNSWVDPRGSNEDEFKWQYLQAYYFAEACQGILDFVEKSMTESRELQEIEKGNKPEPFRAIFGG